MRSQLGNWEQGDDYYANQMNYLSAAMDYYVEGAGYRLKEVDYYLGEADYYIKETDYRLGEADYRVKETDYQAGEINYCFRKTGHPVGEAESRSGEANDRVQMSEKPKGSGKKESKKATFTFLFINRSARQSGVAVKP